MSLSPETEITVRAVCAEDTEQVSQILALSWKTVYRGIIDDGYLDALTHDRWVPLIEKTIVDEWSGAHYWVADRKGKLIGAACLKEPRGQDTAELIAIYLLPEEMGQGAGYRFYTELENRVRANGYTAIKLDVLTDNARARRFYERQGFRYQEESFVEIGGRNYPYIFMKKIFF